PCLLVKAWCDRRRPSKLQGKHRQDHYCTMPNQGIALEERVLRQPAVEDTLCDRQCEGWCPFNQLREQVHVQESRRRFLQECLPLRLVPLHPWCLLLICC